MLSLLSFVLAQQPKMPDFPSKMDFPSDSSAGAGILGALCAGGAVMFLVVFVFFALLPLIGVWKVFSKAGKPGWAVLIPIYNLIVMMDIIGQPASRVIFHLIPVVNIYFSIVDGLALMRTFGKDIGFYLFALFFPWLALPILGFGSARYLGPQAAGGGSPPPAPPRSAPPPAPRAGTRR